MPKILICSTIVMGHLLCSYMDGWFSRHHYIKCGGCTGYELKGRTYMKLKSDLNSFLEIQLKDMHFVGKLAQSNDLVGTHFMPVSFQDEFNTFIQFQIKCLSEIPEELEELFWYKNKVFTGSTRSNDNSRMLSEILNTNISNVEKRNMVSEYLADKLVLFKVRNSRNYLYVDIVEIFDAPTINGVPKFESEYVIIPSPSLKAGESRQDFEEKLVNKQLPFVLPTYPNLMLEPEFILLQGRIYSNFELKKTENALTYIKNMSDEVEYMDIESSKFKDKILLNSLRHSLVVVASKELLNLRDEATKSLHTAVSHLQAERSPVTSTEVAVTEVAPASSMEEQKKNEDNIEAFFLEQFKKNAINKGLYYSDEDLYNFHICMKTNLLTIVGGMSGIGKSQLALVYADTLGMSYGREVLMLPISPAYTEPNDILGYLNPNTGIYNESETGLVRLLLEAEKEDARKDDSKMFIVIFDEMNLAQVEHWFSPFISLLEVSDDKRYLQLFNERSHCMNQYPSKIKIGQNITFVGTVNFDETTKLFSDRLLDRANVFIPKKNTLADMYKHCFGERESMEIEQVHCTKGTYRKWIKREDSSIYHLSKMEIEILDELHRLINEQDRQKGVSFRTAKSIAYYLNNIPKDVSDVPYLNREEAFDLQIKQRIISKIRGIDSFVRPLLNTEEEQVGTLLQYLRLDHTQSYGKFTHTIELIESKMKELTNYGFAY